MATGKLLTLTPIGIPGLSERTTDLSAQGYTSHATHAKDVGYVTSDVKLVAFLYNGNTSSSSLTEIDGNNDADGIIWDATPPDAIGAMSSQKVVITITADGPLEYTAQLAFISSCLIDPILTITGTRAPQLSGDIGYLLFPHNWEDGLDELLAWKTDVMIAHDRTEQRVQLRFLPRRSWDLRLLVSGAQRRKLETWLGMRKTRYMFAPIWRDAVQLKTPISAGESIASIEESCDNYVNGTTIVVWSDWETMEIRSISGHGENYLSVDSPFLRDWPAGAMLAPARYCLSLDGRRVNRFTEDVGDYRIRLMATDDGWEPQSSVTPDTYQSLPVCPFTPTWEDGDEGYDNKWVSLDNDTGVLEFDVQSEEPVFSRSARFLVIGRDSINTMLAFLKERAGRLAPFWLPANDRGFELAAEADADATTITIEPIDYEYALSESPAREHIELRTTDGTIIRRQILDVATLPSGDEQLILGESLPMAISTATLNRCAWLELVRLDSDEITIHWVTPECIEITVPVLVLP